MQRGPGCPVLSGRLVPIGPMLEKNLRARIHTFPGRLMQRSGTAFVSGVDIRPRLNQEIGAARGRLPRRAMQRSGACVVADVDIRPGVDQGAVNIQVGIPNSGAMQWGLAPPIPQVRIGPLLDEVADLVFGLSRGRAMQSRRAIEERINEVFS